MSYRLLLVVTIPYVAGMLVGEKFILIPCSVLFIFGIFSQKLASWISRGN